VSNIAQIMATLSDDSSELRDRIVRDIGNFTVALFAVYESGEAERLQFAGTGTLVSVADLKYILTARHVWEKHLRSAPRIGITLRENTDHYFLMETASIIQFGPEKPDQWGEWGPDLSFLRVPQEYVREINVYRAFYPLLKERMATPAAEIVETSVLMGAPAASGQFTQKHADLAITGHFSGIVARHIRNEFDYIDLDVDVSLPGVPDDFRGVSGGGLWRVLIYRSASTGSIEWSKTLEGVAFHQSDLIEGHRLIRCHARQSIRIALPNAIPASEAK
jgi:hypothetical protein